MDYELDTQMDVDQRMDLGDRPIRILHAMMRVMFRTIGFHRMN